MRRKVLGDEHPNVAISLNNLAALLLKKGNLAAAEPLFREALAMRQKLLGDAHPSVAESLHNLGKLLHEKGDYAQAQPLIREALARWRRALGEDHPQVATAMNSLGRLLYDQRDYAAAELLFRESLSICEKRSEKRGAASAQLGLAQTAVKLGEFVSAEPLIQNAEQAIMSIANPPAEILRQLHVVRVELYEAWNAAEPGTGKAEKAAEWRARIPTTRPATSSSSSTAE